MPRQATVVSIFLASPGDLIAERDVIAGMINSMNLELAHDDIVIQLKRWEALPPGASHRDAQEVVNRISNIGSVDIFLGLMWRRGGSPTAVAESGTIEEYRIALEAWRTKGSPQIAIYFRPFERSEPSTPEQRRQEEVVERFHQEVGSKHLCKKLPARDEAEMERILRTDIRQMVDAAIRNIAINSRSERVFGQDDNRVGPMLIVSGEFALHPDVVTSIQMNSELNERLKAVRLKAPLFKAKTGTTFSYSAAGLLAIAESRASAYLAAALSQTSPAIRRFRITTDAYLPDEDDRDFLALGAYTNDRSLQIVKDPANALVVPAVFRTPTGELDCRFVSRSTGRPIHGPADLRNCDYGIVMRVAPEGQPDRTWLFCGGVSERGTSGSAYFLANRWKELAERLPAGCRHFAALLKIDASSDQRGTLLGIYLEPLALPSFDPPVHNEVYRWDVLTPHH